MDIGIIIVIAVIAIAVGAALGFVARKLFSDSRGDRARESAERIVADAERQAETLRKEATLEAKD